MSGKKSILWFCCVVFSVLLASCSSVPISELHSLYQFKPISASQLPVLDKENVEVINIDMIRGTAKDDIKLHSLVKPPFSVLVWYYDDKENKWSEFGSGVIKGFGDICTVKPVTQKPILYIQFIALQFLDGVKYNTESYKRNDDVNIVIKE